MAGLKAMASLTSDLLARKGAARPAMRRPVADFGRAVIAAGDTPSGPDDLGWNDMGDDGPPSHSPVVAAMPAVVAERHDLESRLRSGGALSAVSAAGRKVAFTLRLDAERHLKLRLACAVERRSAQQIVTQALDMFLAGSPEIDRRARQQPRGSGERMKGG